MSISAEEKDQLVKAGWTVDGTGRMHTGWVQGTAAMHRLFRSNALGVHRVLESDVKQLAVWVEAGFGDEGIVGYVADSDGPGRVAVIQYTKADRRLWVVSHVAQARAEQEGWTRQGVHFWLWTAARQDSNHGREQSVRPDDRKPAEPR